MLYAAEGAKVIVNDPGVAVDGSGHDEGPAAQVVNEIKELGGEATANFDTVAEYAGGENMIKQAVDTYGRIDIVVNTAGILRDRMVFNMTHQEWDDVIAVHLKGHFNTIKPASVLMRQQRFGRIINFSSTSGLVGNTGQVNYGAAKAGIAGITRVVSKDLGRYGVTCNSISPGASTRMTATVPDAARELRSQAGIQGAAGAETQEVSLFTRREPGDVAPMALFLASDDAWDINGQIFLTSGGGVGLMQHPTAERTVFKGGHWEMGELDDAVHNVLLKDKVNPAPPRDDFELPGRDIASQPLA
jgi:hypothetical protein